MPLSPHALPESPEGTLAAFAAGLRLTDVPDDVVDAAIDCITDTMAVALGAWNDDTVRIVSELTQDNGPCTRLADGASVGMRSAALANGVAAHVLDFDDWLPAARVHPSAPLLPAVLATAESATDRTGPPAGTRLLSAFIAGFEVQARIGAALTPTHYAAGFHPTATVGAFGAAAGAAHLLGLNADATARALGLATAQSAGLRTSFGSAAKSLQVGRAAEAGVSAAALAAAGASAPENAVFGLGGFAATHCHEWDESLAGLDSRDHWYLREVLLKRHAACFGTHASIESLLQLRDGLELGQVQEIELTVPELLRTVCAIPQPRTALEGKFSFAFTAALALVRGRCAVTDFTESAVQEAGLRSVVDKVRLRFDPSLPPQQTQVRLLMKDGATRTASSDSSRVPTPAARRVIAQEKLRDLSTPLLGARGAAALLTAIATLRSDTSSADLGMIIRSHHGSHVEDPVV